MGEATGAAYTAADAGHTLNEVGVKHIFALFEQRCLAGFDTVAGYRLQFKVINALLLEPLGNSVGKSAAAGKASPV